MGAAERRWMVAVAIGVTRELNAPDQPPEIRPEPYVASGCWLPAAGVISNDAVMTASRRVVRTRLRNGLSSHDSSDPFADLLAPAKKQLDRTKRFVARLGVEWIELEPAAVFGVGFAVKGDAGDTVVSVHSGGLESMVNFSAGVLRDIDPVRLTILDLCNSVTRDRPAYPVFLHDAELGWDVLVQVSVPAVLLSDSPDFLIGCLRNPPTVANEVRPRFEEAGLGGARYRSSVEDLSRLLIRSLA